MPIALSSERALPPVPLTTYIQFSSQLIIYDWVPSFEKRRLKDPMVRKWYVLYMYVHVHVNTYGLANLFCRSSPMYTCLAIYLLCTFKAHLAYITAKFERIIVV